MLPETINSVGIALVGSLLTFLTGWFWRSRNAAVKRAEVLAEKHDAVLARLQELETKERITSQALTPIITAFQGILIKQLTHDEKPEMDLLMVKVGPPDVLTPGEYGRLMTLLHERTTDMGVEITPSERDAAVILPVVMRMANEEQKNFSHVKGSTDLKLVTIVSIVGAVHKE
jgi:hypothetical protein